MNRGGRWIPFTLLVPMWLAACDKANEPTPSKSQPGSQAKTPLLYTYDLAGVAGMDIAGLDNGGFETCTENTELFTGCDAPVAPPVEAVAATLESPGMMPSANFAEIPNAIDTGLASSRCLALIDPHKTNNVENDVTPTVASCCGSVEFPTPGADGAAPGASDCSCDPRECKCA